MQEFISSVIAYAKENLVLVGIIAACVVAMVVVLIAIGAVNAKKRKQKKLAKQQANEAKTAETTPVEKTVKAEESIAPVEEKSVKETTEVKAEATEAKPEVKETPVEKTTEVNAEATEAKPEVKETPVEKTTEVNAEAVEEKTEAKEAPVEVKAEEKTAQEPTVAPTVAEKKATPVKAQKSAPKKEKAEETVKSSAKMAVAKEEPKQEAAEAQKAKPEAKKQGNRYAGKWVICHLVLEDEKGEEKESAYFFELRASNGELLLSSEEYTSYSGAVAGIETHKSNVEKGNFKITLSKKGDYIFKLLSGKNTLLCTGANYPTEQRAESAVESTKRFAKTAILQEATEELRMRAPVEEDEEEEAEYDESIVGKWIISAKSDANGNKVYYFDLLASNGEKLLSSEEYTTYVGAVNGISTHKTNIEKGKFRISVTKRGDYIFKLLGGNGQLLCLGEHYKTKHRCESAVESVKRFAKSSPVLAAPDINE